MTDASPTDSPRSPAASPRQLILMRHAKSDWSDSTLSDHERPLNHRGKAAAPLMGRWLAEIDAVPELILCSTATRTRETVELLVDTWTRKPEVSYSNDLYLAHPETILKAASSDGCGVTRLMIIAHNPGIASLVGTLAGEMMDMPTAATAVFEAAIPDWDQLRVGSPMKLSHFMRPKAL